MFRALSHAGVLDHGAPGIGNVSEATRKGPSRGRGRLRSRVIRRSPRAALNMRATWKGIFDAEKDRRLDMSDPFVEEAKWKKLTNFGHGKAQLGLDFLDL
jgi:hypothetical protein